ncbi:MAG: ATP-binding protein [Verrucomicrobiae bacterium]|nr:ATP-binding protein [Verrucomicrobiae bacterium]
MTPRLLADSITRWAKQYPIVTITGPRQSGKTTLAKSLFPDHAYVSLEEMDQRAFAREDPRAFLERYPGGVIIDEIQNAPELPSYLQTEVDRVPTPGRFILTGSRQFELMEKVSQSLAGRTAIARLLPFSIDELYPDPAMVPDLNTVLYTGFYPRIHDKGLQATEALSFYISTYLERDVRQVIQIVDFITFERFLKLLAGRTGQLLNLSSLGNDVGVSHNTIKKWISILEASCIIRLLPPWFSNQGKRLVKTPKLYFLDCGLAACLWGVTNPQQLQAHPLRGALFETMVISEVFKSMFHRGKNNPLSFFRNHEGLEVDFVLEGGNGLTVGEIKSAQTIHPGFFDGLSAFEENVSKTFRRLLIHGGREPEFTRQQTRVVPWTQIAPAMPD